MNAKKVVRYQCQRCKCTHETKRGAEACCCCSTRNCNGWGRHTGPGYKDLCDDCYRPIEIKRLREVVINARYKIKKLLTEET